VKRTTQSPKFHWEELPSSIDNNIYSNAYYGFRVSFPQTWTISTTSEFVIDAERDEVDMHITGFVVPPGYEASTQLELLGRSITSTLTERYISKGYGIADLIHASYDNYRQTYASYASYPFYFVNMTLVDSETGESIFNDVRILIQNKSSFYELSLYFPSSHFDDKERSDAVWSEIWDEIVPSISFTQKTKSN